MMEEREIEFGQNPEQIGIDYLGEGMYGALEKIEFSENCAVVYESDSVNDILAWVQSNYSNTCELSVSDIAQVRSKDETASLISKIDKHMGDSKEQMQALESNISEAIESFLNSILKELNKGDDDDEY
jgi:hypothetical protein